VEQLRAIKEPREIDAIRASVECTAKAWESLLPMIQPGVTERQLGAALDYRMMSAGADKPAFDTIVASGPNSAMPHATTTNRALQAGDLVVIDFGARKDGYCCDITQTVGIDKVDSKATAVLDAVVEAWEAGFAAAAPGMPVAEVDKAARDKLVHAGYGEAFTHSLGHGVGLEVHEKPSISRFSDERIEVGMVFTIEPGVYLDGELGVRHERTVLMAPDGPVVL
jgi:Xaa-Pro aminopeptidase